MQKISINYLILFTLLVGASLTQSACQKDDDDCCPQQDREVITSVMLTFVDPIGNTSAVYTYADLDGPGGQVPVIDPIVLSANTTYEVSVEFVDNSDLNNPVFITDEIRAEALEHLVCYSVTGAVPQPTVKDQDTNGDPVGLIVEMQTAGTGTGDLTVTLKHEAAKDSANPCTTGETDVQAVYTVEVF